MRYAGLRSFLLFTGGAVVAALAIQWSAARAVDAARYQDLDLFTSVLHHLRRNYVEEVDETELIRNAVRGMLTQLDPHSSYMDPESHREMQIDTKGEFHGIGIEISKRRDGVIEVIAPIEGTPAALAGIKARDQIVEICPEEPPAKWSEPCGSTSEMTLFEAVRLMRGKRGTPITIRIMRDGFGAPEAFTIVRDVVKVVSVDGRVLEDGYGYIRVRSFQERTTKELRKTLDRVRGEAGGKFVGVVLDLRDNPGGLLDQAVSVSDQWLTGGLIVYTEGRDPSQRHEFRAESGGTEPAYPLVVLMNVGSASASEIVAGALQDRGRALVLGTPSFGKGSVQTVFPLEDGSGLRLTTALYFTPAGRSIQEVGIQPDINVEVVSALAAVGEARPPASDAVRERDLRGHLANPGERQTAADESPAEDVQLVRAVEVLKSWTYFDRLRGSGEPASQAAANTATESATP